jgi:hypothetical protein
VKLFTVALGNRGELFGLVDSDDVVVLKKYGIV